MLCIDHCVWAFSCCGAQASVAVACDLSCLEAWGILLDQGSNPCPWHWQADPQPLDHQGSPVSHFIVLMVVLSHFKKFSEIL